jgi:hypothetical protein
MKTFLLQCGIETLVVHPVNYLTITSRLTTVYEKKYNYYYILQSHILKILRWNDSKCQFRLVQCGYIPTVHIHARAVRLHSDSTHTCSCSAVTFRQYTYMLWMAALPVGHQTAVNKAASHQQTTFRPYFYFVLRCLNSFANQMLARNIAELVNSAHFVTLQATHIFRPRSHHTKLKYKYTCIQVTLSNTANTNSNSNITCTRRC